jgi:hypothetical protein
VGPGESQIILFKKLSQACRFSMSRSYHFTESQASYESLVKTQGSKTQVEYDCYPFQIFFYTMWGGTDYYFLMENHEADHVCNATFGLTLENMQDVENPGTSTWEVKCGPGQTIRRKLIPIDPSV